MRRKMLFLSLCFAATLGWAQVRTAAPARCLGAVEAQLAQERAELQAILAQHHGGQRVDARAFGLPKNDFDDATNLTIRQRLAFRRMHPNLNYPSSGPLQYPRWAFSLMNRIDREGTLSCGPSPSQSKPALVINSNVNVSNDTIPESETYLAIDPTNPQYMVGASNINLNARGQMM